MTKSSEIEDLETVVVAATLEALRKTREYMMEERIARGIENAPLATSADAIALQRSRVMLLRAKDTSVPAMVVAVKVLFLNMEGGMSGSVA